MLGFAKRTDQIRNSITENVREAPLDARGNWSSFCDVLLLQTKCAYLPYICERRPTWTIVYMPTACSEADTFQLLEFLLDFQVFKSFHKLV